MSERNAPILTICLDYTTTIIAYDDVAKRFTDWFNTVFSEQHPITSKDFDFNFVNDAGGYGKVIELHCAAATLFDTRALISLFMDFELHTPPDNPVLKFKVIKND